MMKRIVIIGGGISGLAVLHYLKQRQTAGADIILFEQEPVVGGTIRSLKRDSSLFEWGPNGFLDNQPAALQLIDELGLTGELIEARTSSARRYIQIKGCLHAVPSDFASFMHTPLLSTKDRWSLLRGFFKQNISKDLSIHDYISRRFSENIAETMVDAMIRGIYAGDIKELHMEAAFPKFKRRGFSKPHLRSFRQGMQQVIEALYQRYKESIMVNSPASFPPDADITVIATPAYAAADILKENNPPLAEALKEISYAPIAVVGLLFKKDCLKKLPDGFGYLVPSRENKEILGVLIESNVYEDRAAEDNVMVRVMMGGMRHPDVVNHPQERLLIKAINEIDAVYGLMANPLDGFVRIWHQAIPQYGLNYPQWRRSVAGLCAQTPGLYLCANYLDGISFNDCITNAMHLAQTLKI